VGAIDCVKVYGEANVVGDKDELDHPAVLKKTGSIADGEDIGVAKDRQIFAQAIAFRRTDEYDGARFCTGDIRYVIYTYGKIADG